MLFNGGVFGILALALILDALLGDMPILFRHVPHPVVAVGRLIDWLDQRLNRKNRSFSTRRMRGVLVALFITGLTFGVGWGLQKSLALLPYGWMGEAFLVAVLLAGRSLYDHVKFVAVALRDDGVLAGRQAVVQLAGRNSDALDEHGAARTAVESLAENFSDGVVAPAFWYCLAGLPGLCFYKAVNTLDSMIGYRTEQHRAFGWAAARLDDGVNWLPARLAGGILVLAAHIMPKASGEAAWRIMWRDSGNHASPNAGWPEAAMAGALRFALGGPRQYPGGVTESAWIGEGHSNLMPLDIRKALWLFTTAMITLLIFVLLLAVIIR